MKNIDKKSLVIILILAVNIVFITIPYSIKNHKLQKEINSKSNISTKKQVYDFYNILSDFKSSVKDIITDASVTAKISDNTMNITLKTNTTIKSVLNLLVYINDKLPMLSIKDANISENNSEIVFFLEN